MSLTLLACLPVQALTPCERSGRSETMARDLSTVMFGCGWPFDVGAEREMMAPRDAVYGRDLGERIGLAFRSDQASGCWAGMAKS
jgi:hypothetical protein